MVSCKKFCRGSLSFSYNSLATSSDIFWMIKVGDCVCEQRILAAQRFILKDPHPLNLEGPSGHRTHGPASRVVVAGAGPRQSPGSSLASAALCCSSSEDTHREQHTFTESESSSDNICWPF